MIDNNEENIENNINGNNDSILPDEHDERYEAFDYSDKEKINVSKSYSKRMLKKKRLERKMRKGNIWVSRLRVLIRLILSACIIYSLYYLINSPQWIIDKNIFTTSNPKLEIINNEIVPTYKILNELRKITVYNEPIYKFDTSKIKTSLLELEPIDDIFIRRYWFPARLQIILKERTPLIGIYFNENSDMVSFFTEDGVLIGDDYLPLIHNENLIKVIATEKFRQWDKTKTDKIKELYDYVQAITNDKVNYIDIRNESDIYLQMSNIKIRLGALDDGIYDRLSRIVSIIPKLKNITKQIDYIDLKWKNAAYIKIKN